MKEAAAERRYLKFVVRGNVLPCGGLQPQPSRVLVCDGRCSVGAYVPGTCIRAEQHVQESQHICKGTVFLFIGRLDLAHVVAGRLIPEAVLSWCNRLARRRTPTPHVHYAVRTEI